MITADALLLSEQMLGSTRELKETNAFTWRYIFVQCTCVVQMRGGFDDSDDMDTTCKDETNFRPASG